MSLFLPSGWLRLRAAVAAAARVLVSPKGGEEREEGQIGCLIWLPWLTRVPFLTRMLFVSHWSGLRRPPLRPALAHTDAIRRASRVRPRARSSIRSLRRILYYHTRREKGLFQGKERESSLPPRRKAGEKKKAHYSTRGGYVWSAGGGRVGGCPSHRPRRSGCEESTKAILALVPYCIIGRRLASWVLRTSDGKYCI